MMGLFRKAYLWLTESKTEPEKVSIRHERSGVECDSIGPGWNCVRIQMEIGGGIYIYAGNKPFSDPPESESA